MKYDVFISYRRTAFESANLIAEKLKAKGYTVFFDVETLRSGKFNEQLFSVIENCKDLVVILPENALDRCSDPEDWVRKEVCHAMKLNKNIIPVMLAGFEWPKPMPTGMEELCNYQAISAGEREFFDMSIQRLSQYLTAKPHKRLFSLISRIAIIVTIAAVLLVTAYLTLRQMAVPESQNISNETVKALVMTNATMSDINTLYEQWEKYIQHSGKGVNSETKAHYTADILATIDLYEKNIRNRQYICDSTKFQLTDYQSFLIGLYGIDKAEIAAIPLSYRMTSDEVFSLLDGMKQVALSEPRLSVQEELIKAQKEGLQCLVNADYYAFLEIISKLPKEAHTSLLEISDQLTNMPNGVAIGLASEEYQRFNSREFEKYNELMKGVQNMADKLESRLEAIEYDMENLDQQLSSNDDIDYSTEEENLIPQIRDLEKESRELDELKQEVAEMRNKLDESHDKIKAQCQFQKGDDQYLKWGKIVHWANYMATSCGFYYQYKREGLEPLASATPQSIYNDLESLLNQYQKDHPETVSYVETAKAFYKEVSQGKRQLTGVIIMGFKDNAIHPVYKVGDIVIERNGKNVASFNQINAAANKEGDDKTKFLRLINGQLVVMNETIPHSDVLIGYLPITETD